MYISASYVASYFFLLGFMTFVITLSTKTTEKCKTPIYLWIEVSAIYYLIATIISASLVVAIK